MTRARLLNTRQEVGAADQLHREEDIVALGHDELVEAHEVRAMDIGKGPELLLQAIEGRRSEVEQTLERDGLAAFTIEGLIDNSHSAFAYATHDVVAFAASPLGVPIVWVEEGAVSVALWPLSVRTESP